MHKVIDISLIGRANPFRLHEDAYDALNQYLDHARSRLTDDADQAEVIGDLERSISAKLTDRLGSEDRILAIEDIDTVLLAIGSVGTGDDQPATVVADRPRGRRRLYRIREARWIAGVCTGLAAYTQVGVDWVRTVFLLLTVATAGVFLVVYLALVFILPVAATREEWIAGLDRVS